MSGLQVERRGEGTISIGGHGAEWALLVLAALPALLGLLGLASSGDLPGWTVIGSAILVYLGAMFTAVWAIATVAELELRGLITDVWHVEIQRAALARHYRDTPARPTLKARGRTWPLEALRRIELGEREKILALYLVLEDEVLHVVTPGAGAKELDEVGRELSEAVGVPFQAQVDRDWQSATSGPALLVIVPLLTIGGGALGSWALAASSAPLPAAAVGLATVTFPLAWRFIIAGATRRIMLPAGRAYVRERFGIEPRA